MNPVVDLEADPEVDLKLDLFIGPLNLNGPFILRNWQCANYVNSDIDDFDIDSNIVDQGGKTPFYFAYYKGQLEVVKWIWL